MIGGAAGESVEHVCSYFCSRSSTVFEGMCKLAKERKSGPRCTVCVVYSLAATVHPYHLEKITGTGLMTDTIDDHVVDTVCTCDPHCLRTGCNWGMARGWISEWLFFVVC